VRDRGIAPLADIPDCQRRDGPPELVVGRKGAVVAMPVLPRRRDEVRHAIELTFRRQGHPWPLPPWAVAAKAKVWLDRRGDESEKQTGQLRLQASLTSMSAGQECCSWSWQRPQS
jgi:hypothetical protein